MSILRPIINFLGAIIGVDPDEWPKADEDALRRYADSYDAIAAHLRTQLGPTAQQAADSLAAAWNGEGGRALAGQLTHFVTLEDSGGIEAIAKNAETIAQYLRDQADTVARTKQMIYAQIAIGVLLFLVPAARGVSMLFRRALINRFKSWLKGRIAVAIRKGIAEAVMNAARSPGPVLKALLPGAITGAAGAGLFGLGPNTWAQTYGQLTGKDGRGEFDNGQYHHEDGWNWDETKSSALVAATAIPLAAVAGAGATVAGRAAVRQVGFSTEAMNWAGRRLRGAAAMAGSMPLATKIVTGQNPTGSDFWHAAVMGAAMPSEPFKPAIDAVKEVRPQHSDVTPVDPAGPRETTKIEGAGERTLPPDPPNPPELAAKPEGQAGNAPPADGNANTTAAAPETGASAAAGQRADGVVQPGVTASAVPASGGTQAGGRSEPGIRTPGANQTGDGSTAKPADTRVPADGSGRGPDGPPGENKASTEQTKPAVGEPAKSSELPRNPSGEATGTPTSDPAQKVAVAGRDQAPADGSARHDVRRADGADRRTPDRDASRPDDAKSPTAVAEQRVKDAQEKVKENQAALDRVADGQDSTAAAGRLALSEDVARKAEQALAAERSFKELVEARKAPSTEQAQRQAGEAAEKLAAAKHDVQDQTKAAAKATRNATKAEMAEARLDEASARLKSAEAADALARKQVDEARKADESEQEARWDAEAQRLWSLAAEVDPKLARLTADQLRQLFDGPLKGFDHLGVDARRFLAIHEMIHRSKTTDGWGFALQWQQIKAALVLRAELLADMKAGEGKTAVGAVALGMIAADHPVHFMTWNRDLAVRDHAGLRQVLEPLGVDVRLASQNHREPTPKRPTVYVGDEASFGWSMGKGHRVPGKHIIVDEVDAVAYDGRARKFSQSLGSSGPADGRTKAAVLGAKNRLDDGEIVRTDFDLTAQERPRLTPEGSEKLAALTGETVDSRRFKAVADRVEIAAQARWVMVDGVDYLRESIRDVETIVIIDQHTNAPLIDHESLVVQRWDKLAQALEAEHGMEVLADPTHINAVTMLELLKSYDHFSGMSGTAKFAEHLIRDLYGPDRVGRAVEIVPANEPKLVVAPEQTFATVREKLQEVVTQTIADMLRTGDGDPRNGLPQPIIVKNDLEVGMVKQLLEQRLDELGHGVRRIQDVTARRLTQLINRSVVENDPGLYAREMSEIWRQVGERGTITVGDTMDRGTNFGVSGDVFVPGEVPARGSNVYTIREGANLGREAVEGGLHERVTYRDQESPRGDEQRRKRVGRQGAPAKVDVYTSAEDALFQNRRGAPESAVAYHDSRAAANHRSALRIYTEAAIAHGRAAAAHASTITNHAKAIADQENDSAKAAHAGTEQAAAELRSSEEALHQTSEALRRADEGRRRAEESLQFGAHWDYDDQIVALQQNPNGNAGQPAEMRSPAGQIVHTAVPQKPVLTHRLGAPELDGDNWMEPRPRNPLVAMTRGGDHPESPGEQPIRTPGSLADATNLGERTSLPPQLSSAGKAGRLASTDPYAGAYLLPGPDGSDWVVKLYPDNPVNAETVEAELKGIYGAYLTGFGPVPYGLVRVKVDERPYVGVAMSPVHGGLIEAEERDASAAAIDEAAHWRSRVTFDTVRQLDLYGEQLLKAGYSIRRDLEYFVDGEGNFRRIDLAGVEPLPDDPFYRKFWIERQQDALADRRAPLLSAAIANAKQRHPSNWEEATDLGELPSSLQRLSSAGEIGSVARLGHHSGVYLIEGPDRQRVVKLWPDSGTVEQQRRFRTQAMAEYEGLFAAASTGYGPTPYGLVRATIAGRSYVGVSMALVPGGFIRTQSEDPTLVEETDRWRAAVTFDTVRQFDQYLQRLLDAGYHIRTDLQYFVDAEGNFRPIDFEFVTKLPEDPVAQSTAIDNHGLGSFIARGLRDQLLAAAIDNAKRRGEASPSGRARLRNEPIEGAGLTVEAGQRVVDDVRRRMRLPLGLNLKIVVGADNDALAQEHGIEVSSGPRPGYFRMEEGVGVVYLSAQDHRSAEDVAASVWHEVVGHFGWRLFSPQVRSEILDTVHQFRGLDPELSAEIDELYAGQPSDVRDEEFLARLAEGGVPTRLRQAWNGLLSTRLGDALARIGAISNETLDQARHDHHLEPLHQLVRALVRAIRQNRYDGDGLPASTSGSQRRVRAHRDQLRGGAGSIHRSDFRGDGRTRPDPVAVRAAAAAAAPQIAAAVAATRGEAASVTISGDRITITLDDGRQVTALLDVSGDFTNAGPVRWEHSAQATDWARITVSPRAADAVVGRAIAHAVAGVLAAYRGESPIDQARAGRRAEVGYLVDRLEAGESPHHLRKELRLLLQHMNKSEGQLRGLPPLPRGLRRRVGGVLRRNAAHAWMADEVMPRIDQHEDQLTDPVSFRPTQLPGTDTTPAFAPDLAVDRFVHRLFQHFANQPETSAEPGDSASRRKVLREQPLLRQLVDRHGTATVATLGRLSPDDFMSRIDSADQQAVAGVFSKLRALLDEREHAESWHHRRTAARRFAELADALGVIGNDDLRAALPHDLAAAVADLEPSLLARINRAIDDGVSSLPSLRAELILGLAETVPSGAISAVVLAGHGRVGLAATVLAGATLAWPLRAVVNRYVDAREERVKSDRRNYRRELDEQSRSTQRASVAGSIRTAYQQLLTAASSRNGHTIDTEGPKAPRAELAAAEVKTPPLTAPWWTFPLRSSVPVAAAALPMALVVSPLVVGATIGLAAAVAGIAQYRFARHQSTLDDERRTRDYEWRSWRQLVGELRRSADVLVRLRVLGNELGDATISLPTFTFDPPTDHIGRGVIPSKPFFAARELLLGVVPLAQRTANVYVQQQLASATAAVLEAMVRLGAIGAVTGVVEAFHAEANRHAFDRRMHNWLELLRAGVQSSAEEITDPVLTQLDHLLTNANPQTELQIPPVPPWSPVVHPDREATTNRRWYAVGAVAIGGAGIGVAAWMVNNYHLDPVYLDLAAVAGAFQPVSYYAKYLRRRIRVKADVDERDRGAEQRAAVELDRDRAAAADAAHQVDRLGDVIDGKPPRNRPDPTTELGLFIESERRDNNSSAELSRLLSRLADLDAERQRVLDRYDQHLPTELQELTEVLVAISTTISQYADATHKLGVDPHVRLGGPDDRPVSASVLHHDPLNARNLTDLTWAPGRRHRPSVEAENAALIAAKIQQATDDRYGPLSMAQIQARAQTGQRLVDIAADLVADSERRRTPSWMARATADSRVLRASVDFRRSLTADQARAVPARLLQQERLPVDWPTYAGMHAKALHRQQIELITRAAARTESAAVTDQPDQAERHRAIAAACTAAAQQAEQARKAWQAFRAKPTPVSLQAAQHEDALYQQRLAESLPTKDALQTAIVSGRLPHLTALTNALNQALVGKGKTFRFTPELLHRRLRAETRRLLSPGGVVMTVGNDPEADVSELTQFEITLDPAELQEVLDSPVGFDEGQLGQLVQGGYSIGSTATQNFGVSGGLNLGPALSALPDTNPVKALAHVVSPSVEYAKSVAHSVTGGATEYGLPGTVEVIKGEILRFRSARPRWSWRMRTSAVGQWSSQHQVAVGAQQDATTLDLGISHTYTVGAPEDTVTITSLGLADERRTDLPEHVASRVDGLSELADRAIEGLKQRLGSLDRIAHDQLRGLLTEDAPGRLAETTSPGGLTRIITSGGRAVAYARLETVAVWDRSTLLSDSSMDHKVERLRVGFSGASGSQTFSAGDSFAASASTALTDVGPSSWDGGPTAKAGRSTGRDTTVSTGDTAIHPSVQRIQPTVGVKLRLEHRLTIHRIDTSDSFTLTTAGDAVLRMPENDAFRYGLPVPSAALVIGSDGQPQYGTDGRLLLRGDPQPTDEAIALPVWMQDGRRQVRGAGPALVQEFRGADQALGQCIDHLVAEGLVPTGDLAGQDPALAASQLANLERVGQQLARHRLETGYDPAAQEGVVFRLDRHRTGFPPEQHTYRITLRPYTGEAKLLGLTTGETVVNLDIGSNTTSRSGGWSRSLPWLAKLGFSNKPTAGHAGLTPEAGPGYGRSSRGRSISWGTGSTVNRVSLTESTAPVAVFEVPHTLTITEVTATGDSAPIVELDGSARLSVDSEFCRRADAMPAPSIDGEVDPLLLRSATFQAIDVGDPVQRLTAVLPELARGDSSALHHLSAFLNPRNLAARPELLTAPYRTSLMITPVPSGPGQALAHHGLTTGRASLRITSAVQNLKYVGSGHPINGEINLTLSSRSLTIGMSTGDTTALGAGLGGVEADGTSYGGSLGLSRSGGRSTSATETQIGGIERLAIRDGEHYQFWGDLTLAAQLQAVGAAPHSVELSSGAIVLTMPERDVLRLYGRGELDLPAEKVADAVERLLQGELNLPPRTVVALFRRYAAGAPADLERLAANLRELTGLSEASYPTLDTVLPAAEAITDQQTEVGLPEYYANTMGAALIDETSLQDADGNETEPYREVLDAMEQSSPEALDDPVLASGLRGDLAGRRWHGHFDDLVSRSGFVTEYPTGDGPQLPVRMNLAFEGPVTIDGVPDEGGEENVFSIVQIYDYAEEGRGVTSAITHSGQVGGALAEGAAGTAGVGTDLSTSTTASSTEQNTRMTRALWAPVKRVSRDYRLTVQVGQSEPRILTGRMTLLVPASVINAEPPAQTVDPKQVTLPRGTVVEGTTADHLFATVHGRLGRSDMLTEAGSTLHRTTVESMLSAATRLAAFERIASPEGHPMVQLPVPGHRSRAVAVRVRAELSRMRLITEGTAQLGQIDRQQGITQVTAKSNRLLPAGRSLGGSSPAAGIQAGASSGEQVGEKVTDTTGNRNETTMLETAQVVTVKVDVTYHLDYERRLIDRNGGSRTDRTDTGLVTGEAYLTMFRHEYDVLCGRLPSTRPARTVTEAKPHTSGSFVPADPSGTN